MGAAAPPSNFRDLGGLRSTHGSLVPNRLLRAGLHDRPGEPPAGVEAGGVHVFDLRSERECVAPADPAALARHHPWPMHDPEWLAEPSRRTEEFFVASAVRQLRLAGPLLAAALEVLAAGEGVLLGCRLGKDRTGMIVLALGHLLGLGEDDLVADYCRTAAAYAAAPAWVRAYAERRGEPVAEVARRLAPSPAVPRGILSALGSAEPSIVEGWDLEPELIGRAARAVVSNAVPLTRGVMS